MCNFFLFLITGDNPPFSTFMLDTFVFKDSRPKQKKKQSFVTSKLCLPKHFFRVSESTVYPRNYEPPFPITTKNEFDETGVRLTLVRCSALWGVTAYSVIAKYTVRYVTICLGHRGEIIARPKYVHFSHTPSRGSIAPPSD